MSLPLIATSRVRLAQKAMQAESGVFLACRAMIAAPTVAITAATMMAQRSSDSSWVEAQDTELATFIGIAIFLYPYIATVVAFAVAHHYFLVQLPAGDGTRIRFRSKTFAWFLLYTVMLTIAAPITFVLAVKMGANVSQFALEPIGVPAGSIGLLFALMILAVLILFCALAPILPAAVLGQTPEILNEIRHGGALRLFGSMIYGPVLLAPLVYFAVKIFGAAVAAIMMSLFEPLGRGVALVAAVLAAAWLAGSALLFLTSMTAATLCRHYIAGKRRIQDE